MSAERTRGSWTDERIDDLADRMDRGFARVDEELRAQRIELGGRIDAVGARIDALQRTMILAVITLTVGFAGLILAQLAAG